MANSNRRAHDFGPTHTLFNHKGYAQWKNARVEERWAVSRPKQIEKSHRVARRKSRARRYHPDDIRLLLRRLK